MAFCCGDDIDRLSSALELKDCPCNNGNMTEELRFDKSGSLKENRPYTYDFDDRLWKVEISNGGEAFL